jgi:hypothetical protein
MSVSSVWWNEKATYYFSRAHTLFIGLADKWSSGSIQLAACIELEWPWTRFDATLRTPSARSMKCTGCSGSQLIPVVSRPFATHHRESLMGVVQAVVRSQMDGRRRQAVRDVRSHNLTALIEFTHDFDANLNINLAIEIDRDMATSFQAAGAHEVPHLTAGVRHDRASSAGRTRWRTTASSAGTTSTPDSNPAAYVRLAHLPTF